jgi:photosystem II PsbZ protein
VVVPGRQIILLALWRCRAGAGAGAAFRDSVSSLVGSFRVGVDRVCRGNEIRCLGAAARCVFLAGASGSWPGVGVGGEGFLVQCPRLPPLHRWRASSEQIALQGQVRHQRKLLFGFRGHGGEGAGGLIVGAAPSPTTCEGKAVSAPGAFSARVRIRLLPDLASRDPTMQILNTLTVLALVVLSFALIVAVPVLYASSEDSGRSNRLVLLGGLAWVALVLLNWGMSYFVV